MTPQPTRSDKFTGLVKMAYRYPEKLDKVKQPDGSVLTFRPAGAPTRVAYDSDWNTWYEEVKING